MLHRNIIQSIDYQLIITVLCFLMTHNDEKNRNVSVSITYLELDIKH